MAGIEFTFYNLFMLTATLSPMLIGFFMIMVSIMNENVKGIVYIAGALLALTLNYPIQSALDIKSTPAAGMELVCSPFAFEGLGSYSSPASSSLFIGFTLAYLLLPMWVNQVFNYGVVSTLSVLLLSDAYARVHVNCTSVSGAVLGAVIGAVFGTLWYVVLRMGKADHLLYFGELDSNALRCDMPKKQTFKCSVYKNGQLISSHLA